MALLISRATGNFTSASTWGVADSATGSQLTNPSASTNTTTAYVYSSAFTGTNTKVADGVVLFLKRVNTTGTFSVALSDDNGTTATREVTINASDLFDETSWVFFKFGSTLTLDGGTDYKVGIKGSSAGNVTVYRDATAGNWGRIISTTDTAAPAAGDAMLITGEWTGAGASTTYTVTMDNTASTDFGTGGASGGAVTQANPRTFNGLQIGQNGTLTWGTSAATAYYLKLSGNLNVWAGGTYNMGTTGTPCPRDSSMYLQFDCVADGDFVFNSMTYCTLNMQGQSRTSGKDVWWCKLNTDEAVGSTSLGVDTDTGWLDNDLIAIASTTRTYSQCEAGALNGTAGASTLTVDGFAGAGGGLAFDHSGTSPTQAEIILLTRNVRISGTSGTVSTAINLNSGTIDIDWSEFFWISSVNISALVSGQSCNMQYCCVREAESRGIFQTGTNNAGTIVISNNSVYNASKVTGVGGIVTQATTTASSLTVSNNVLVLPTSTNAAVGLAAGSSGIFDNNIVAGSSGDAYNVALSVSGSSFNGNVAHSSAGNGVLFNPGSNIVEFTFDNLNIWRCNSNGIRGPNAFSTLNITDATITGCTTGVNLATSSAGVRMTFSNVSITTEASYATATGFTWTNATSTSSNGLNITFNDCTIDTTTTGIVAGYGSNNFVYLNNTLVTAPTEVSNQANMGAGFIKSSKHDQTEGAFKSWFSTGTIERDSTIYNTASPSERLTPISASLKLQSGTRVAAVDDGGTITINAYVRKSAAGDGAAYNGNQPRLMVRANLAAGITSDTVLDTMTASTGTWEQLTGTTAAVNADGALEFFVDCGGTTGWVNVDDWSVS